MDTQDFSTRFSRHISAHTGDEKAAPIMLRVQIAYMHYIKDGLGISDNITIIFLIAFE